jgi:hypothetical protein
MARVFLIFLFTFFLLQVESVAQDSKSKTDEWVIDQFMSLIVQNGYQDRALELIDEHWDSSFMVMAVEVLYLCRDQRVNSRLQAIILKHEGLDYKFDFAKWYDWMWEREQNTMAHYADFKAQLYRLIDPKFETYFTGRYNASVRLDEIRWGGVIQDGIPPLRYPEMIDAKQADYLEYDNVVFGIEVNGDVRAYPKRILAWHEMFVDTVGGVPVCGVYCTLCGTVILYVTEHNGKNYELGTSGFLYRSNKLMYDKQSQSLWNTVWGEPVLGPLQGKGIVLEPLSVVTTTWSTWKKRHPDTKVLSLETGYQRDYGEGVAYREYFATDDLMFNVPFEDNRLKNKDEVLAMRMSEYPDEQLAISVDYLRKNPVYHDAIGAVGFVVFTDKSGANRVYKSNGFSFISYNGKEAIMDEKGNKWILHEDRIEMEGSSITCKRLPYHRAFWFGWHAAYPNTRLVY